MMEDIRTAKLVDPVHRSLRQHILLKLTLVIVYCGTPLVVIPIIHKVS